MPILGFPWRNSNYAQVGKSLRVFVDILTIVLVLLTVVLFTTVLVDGTVGVGTLEVLVELTIIVDTGNVVVDKTIPIFNYVTVWVGM
jgi:apolipoprotein N-acyltransferase